MSSAGDSQEDAAEGTAAEGGDDENSVLRSVVRDGEGKQPARERSPPPPPPPGANTHMLLHLPPVESLSPPPPLPCSIVQTAKFYSSVLEILFSLFCDSNIRYGSS